MNGGRKSHRKSRLGCYGCKRRRIKCDEEKLICLHCLRHDTECIYPDESTLPLVSTNSRRYSSQDVSPQDSTPISQPFFGSEILKLELLHFYTTRTCFTLCNISKRQLVMQYTLPLIGLSHPFVLQGIFALSALHLAHCEPNRKEVLLTTASQYCQAALPSFRSEMAKLTPDNCDPCFAFSFILPIYTCAASTDTCAHMFSDLFSGDGGGTVQISGSIDLMNLLRGVLGVLIEGTDWISKGPLGPLLKFWDDNHIEMPSFLPSPDISQRFSTLRSLWQPGNFTKLEIEDLNQAQTSLESAYEWLIRYGDKVSLVGVVMSWPIQLGEHLVKLLNERRPEALALIAHYSLLLNFVDDYWWIKGMSRQVLQKVRATLGPARELWIRWPLEELERRHSFKNAQQTGGLGGPSSALDPNLIPSAHD